MVIRQYLVDAFAEELFQGNQAAVCVTETELDDELMQQIAIENNFSETAFLVPKSSDEKTVRYALRWFTPGGEIDLCGHATLASAFVIFTYLAPDALEVIFDTKSGELYAKMEDGFISMEMPAYHSKQVEVTDDMERAFGVRPLEAWMDRDLVCMLPSEQDVYACAPDDADLLKLDGLLQVVTAPGRDFDCVSRCFAPKLAVHEDPVTGSSHCALVPLWASKLGKNKIDAWQASQRGGRLVCKVSGDTVELGGHAVLYAKAELYL